VRVLMSAYACQPGLGSEHYVGHHWVKQAARRHEVIVLTDARNRDAIGRHDYGRNVRFEFVEGLSSEIRGGRQFRDWRGREWLGYYRFLLKSYVRARDLLRKPGFDVSHVVTWANFRWPNLLALLPRPSILGPVGGGDEYPTGFERSLYERARSASIRLSRIDPVLRLTLRRTSVILAANANTARALPASVLSRVRIAHAGIDVGEFDAWRREERVGPFQIMWVGLLIPRKGLDLLLEAVARVHECLGEGFRVVVFGDGPEGPRLRAQAEALGVWQHIDWRGWVSREDVLRGYRQTDALFFTSLRETMPMTVLEGMLAGLPVVCLGHTGQGEMITRESGIPIRAGGRGEVVDDLASALRDLAGSPDLRRSLGDKARRRATELYGWNSCGDAMDGLYREVVSTRGKGSDDAARETGTVV
jgi:glycosyltransferase involved in cell wall biosynthesis